MPRCSIIHVTLGLIRIMIKKISISTTSNYIMTRLQYNHMYFQFLKYPKILSIVKLKVTMKKQQEDGQQNRQQSSKVDNFPNEVRATLSTPTVPAVPALLLTVILLHVLCSQLTLLSQLVPGESPGFPLSYIMQQVQVLTQLIQYSSLLSTTDSSPLHVLQALHYLYSTFTSTSL